MKRDDLSRFAFQFCAFMDHINFTVVVAFSPAVGSGFPVTVTPIPLPLCGSGVRERGVSWGVTGVTLARYQRVIRED